MKKSIPIVAICAVLIIEIIALLKGINGVGLSTSIAAISGLGGYTLKSWRDNRSKQNGK